MTTHVVIRNHGFTLQATFEEKGPDGVYQPTSTVVIKPDQPEVDFTIWDTKRIIVEEIPTVVAEA